MSRKEHLRIVLRALESDGAVGLWDYLLAFETACQVLGGRLPGPIGRKGFHERMVGMNLAAASDLPSK